MLMGHTDGLPKRGSSKDLLLDDHVSELGANEEEDAAGEILYMASFEELAAKNIQYDTIIWLSISLVLVLAWGIGIIMLLYLPVKRYVLRKDISSRKLYVTPNEIVYKVSRPSFIPFWGVANVEKHVPLALVIDIIIEQDHARLAMDVEANVADYEKDLFSPARVEVDDRTKRAPRGWRGCLQSVYGIHTFRVESIAYGKAAPVDELQVQGVYKPGLLRKVILTEASKVMQEVHTMEGETMARMESLTNTPAAMRSPGPVAMRSPGPAAMRSPSKSWKMTGSPRHASMEHRTVPPSDLLLHKLEEVNRSVKRLEVLIEKSQATPEGGQ
ncbi:hypothetical protein RJ640_000996 [Escallonia rubra]|uniref:DUF7642 domain-containing protein n=1 Tax=Escallonia rubra TaxID=112253 RepID=A0AA88QNP4_9ASTE|nr:hypothetical protein RJ640_000996 [Escallonia rubra]